MNTRLTPPPPGDARLGSRGERGFTLIEVLIAVALLGVTTGVMTKVFLLSYQAWKWNFDSLILQRNIRTSMATITRSLREAKPGSVVISRWTATEPMYSQIAFLDGRGNGWIFRQTGNRIFAVMPPPAGLTVSSTRMMASDIDAMTFTYPNFQDLSLIDVAITGRKVPYNPAPKPILVQLVERSMLRNP